MRKLYGRAIVIPYLLALVALVAYGVMAQKPRAYAQAGRDAVTCSMASGIVLPFPGADATSHSGWSRYTALDSKFVFVTTGDDAEGTGGASTHTLVGDQHRHTFTAGAASAQDYYDSMAMYSKGARPACTGHTHASTNGAYATITYGTANNAPAAYTVIWKESDGTTQVPTGFLAFSSVSAPTGWRTYTTAGDKFLKGAAASGDGGSNTGSDSHGHRPSGKHSHGATNSAAASAACSVKYLLAAGEHARGTHVHSVSLNSGTSTTPQNSTDIPAWEQSLLVENNSGSTQYAFEGMYAYWSGAAASIPSGWVRDDLTDGYDFERTTLNADEIGNTGGLRTHAAHTVASSHNHGYTAGNASLACTNPGPDAGFSYFYHTHTWTIGSTTETTQATAEYGHYPEYVKLIRIRCAGTPTPVPVSADTFDRFRRGGSRR